MNGDEMERLWKTLTKFEKGLEKFGDENKKAHGAIMDKIDEWNDDLRAHISDDTKSFVTWKAFAGIFAIVGTVSGVLIYIYS